MTVEGDAPRQIRRGAVEECPFCEDYCGNLWHHIMKKHPEVGEQYEEVRVRALDGDVPAIVEDYE